MSRLVMFIGFLIFLILVLLWFCLKASSRAEILEKKLLETNRILNTRTREYNTLCLKYVAQKEALEANVNQHSSAKH